MASTVLAQTLLVTISESINLNGQQINSENTLAILSINAIDKRIVAIPSTGETTIIKFAAGVAAGTLVNTSVKYIRITNKDNTYYVRVRVTKVSGATFDVMVKPGQSHIMSSVKMSVSETGVAFAAFVDSDNISAQAETASGSAGIDIEFFAASSN